MIIVPIVPYLAALLAGCAIFHVNSAANHTRSGPTPVAATRATMRMQASDLPAAVFVGVAMSGGGARAANFSAATLLELEDLGFLQYASAVSAVSGSALAAAYYGVYGRADQPPDERRAHWDDHPVRQRFRFNFETNWILRWFYPWNIVRYWLTDFDRSDIMKRTFDAHLFRDRRPPRFNDMGETLPRILINATSLPEAGPFVFTDEAFEALGSRLDEYPLTHAVMASGAFPGAFHNVTLQDFERRGYYQHLFDGGPSDNLGVNTLLTMIDAVKPTGGCFLFIVDAYTYQRGRGERRSDTRNVSDFIVDQNALAASDVLLTLRRYDTLHRRLGYPGREVGEVPRWAFKTAGGVECQAWHFTFQSLLKRRESRTEATRQKRDALRRQLEEERARERERNVNLVTTRYRLEGPKDLTPEEVQTLLFDVARHLVRDDLVLKTVCDWFTTRELPACGLAGEAAQ